MRARQVARPDRPRPFRGLEFPQDFEGLREFFRGSGHGRVPSILVSPLSDCVVRNLYYCAACLLSYRVVPRLSYCVETGPCPAGLEMTEARFPVPISLSLAANFLFARKTATRRQRASFRVSLLQFSKCLRPARSNCPQALKSPSHDSQRKKRKRHAGRS